MNTFDYLIIGNSAGAVGCIEGLRSLDQRGSIGLVAEENHHVYSRALIPYYLGGVISFEKMYYRPFDFYDQARVTRISGQKAVHLDPANQSIALASGEKISYDKLLLATGGKPFFPPVPGINRKNVFSFHSFDDLLGIEKILASARHAVVLGGGVIGLMAAEVLRKKGLQVSVIELADRVLGPVIDETASELVVKAFRRAGVDMFLGTTIEDIQGEELVEKIILKDGTIIPCDLLIVGVGVTPRTELVESTGIAINRGILVDKQMQTSIPGIYACGDCAANYNFVTGEVQPLPFWPNAYQGGRTAAYNMAGVPREYTDGTSMNAMHFFDLNIINAGFNLTNTNTESNDSVSWEVVQSLDQGNSNYRKFILDQHGVIKGFILTGQIDRAGIYLNLMRKQVDVRSFAQVLLDEQFSYAALPDQLRWQLLKEDVILGVV